MIDKKLFKDWDNIIKSHKEKWAKDLYELILKNRYWDISFDRYAKYRLFLMQFEEQIKQVLASAREQFPDLNMEFEDVAHDLFRAVTDDEGVIKELEQVTSEILKTLPKA